MRRSLLLSLYLGALLAAGLALQDRLAAAADAVRTIAIVKNAEGKFVFSVPKAKIEAGESVKWVAKDANVPHQLVADTEEDAFKDTGEFDSSKPPKQKFSAAGVVKYHCTIHPSMKGSIRVTAAEPPAEPRRAPAAESDDAPAEVPAEAPAPAPPKKAPAKKAPPPSYDPY